MSREDEIDLAVGDALFLHGGTEPDPGPLNYVDPGNLSQEALEDIQRVQQYGKVPLYFPFVLTAGTILGLFLCLKGVEVLVRWLS